LKALESSSKGGSLRAAISRQPEEVDGDLDEWDNGFGKMEQTVLD
jgi:hypothetical protein